MENLGVCADLTGGQVEMVDLRSLSSKISTMLADPILGTGLEMKVIVGRGASLCADATVSFTGNACTASRSVGNVTGKTTTTVGVVCSSADLGGSGRVLPLQLQLQYTRPSGEKVMQVRTVYWPCSESREDAEADIDGTCVALAGIHAAARLAQSGSYRAARAHLISTSRLLQRAMHALPHQDAYLSYVVQAEKLDGFMRERESQDKVFGAESTAQRGRDDDASRSMYQMKSLSVEEFKRSRG